MLYASFGFLFYFFDVAWVFQRDFFTGADAGVGPAYALIMSLLMVLAGCGFLTSFWLLVCDYVGETRKALKVIPAVVFVAASVAVLLIVPEGGLRAASAADRAGLTGSQWQALQRGLDDVASYTATLRACAPVAAELKPQLRALLQYHCGSPTLRTRQLMIDLQSL